MARLDNIFLTRMHWCNVGGLCGKYILSEVRGWREVSGILACLVLFFFFLLRSSKARGAGILSTLALSATAWKPVTQKDRFEQECCFQALSSTLFIELLDWRYVPVNWRV